MNNQAPVIKMAPTAVDDLRQSVKEMMTPFMLKLDRYDIPDEKLEAIIDYGVDFYAKHHRHMNEERMIRKIAEYFKLQLKTQTDGAD